MEKRVLLAADSGALAMMTDINAQLAEAGMNVAAAEIEYFTIGNGRPADRILQQPFRWVENDPRRLAQGNDITYLVDQSDGATTSGLANAQTELAIDRAMETWDGLHAMRKVEIEKRPDPGDDPDIFDAFFGFGGVGNPFFADIVHAGWLPRDYFEAVGGPGGGDGILAFSVTFVFTDDLENPTDINNDGYLDIALNEVYYNDTFGDPGGNRGDNPWGINVPLPGVDVETVALHEVGHSLGLGHFGPPPGAVMNPIYAGINHSPDATDVAALRTIWSNWGAATDTPPPANNPRDASSTALASPSGNDAGGDTDSAATRSTADLDPALATLADRLSRPI